MDLSSNCLFLKCHSYSLLRISASCLFYFSFIFTFTRKILYLILVSIFGERYHKKTYRLFIILIMNPWKTRIWLFNKEVEIVIFLLLTVSCRSWSKCEWREKNSSLMHKVLFPPWKKWAYGPFMQTYQRKFFDGTLKCKELCGWAMFWN